MKIITRLSFICISIIVATIIHIQSAQAQNYLHESFDGTTFPPSGWSDVYVNGSSMTGGDTVWYRQTDSGLTFPAGIYPHTGRGMASYNSWNMEANSNALLVTPAINFTAYATGSNILSFWFYKSNDIAGGFSGSESDHISVWLDTSAYLATPKLLRAFMNGINEPPIVATEGWYQYTLLIPDSLATSPHVYIIFEATSNYDDDLFLDDVSIDHVPPCGTPTVTLSPLSQNIHLCVGDTFLLAKSNSFMPADQKYQWQSAFSVIGPWSNITGATNATYKGTTVSGTEYFRLKDSCIVSGQSAYSSIDTINAGPPSYASLPYVQDFETWENYCSVLDVPDGNWVNTPNVGHSSWRRNDQGCSLGNWISNCSYTINSWGGNASDSGLHCARFHSSGILPDTASVWKGSLDMYVNCNVVGNKKLKFSYINQKVPYSPYPEYNNDSIKVLLSTDGGVTFSEIWSADTAQYWEKVNLEITSASATSIIRFLAKRNGGNPASYGYTYDLSDIGIDNVQLIPACNGKPVAGILTPDTICAGKSFTKQLMGTSLAENLAYQWQKSTDSLTWVDIAGDTSDIDTFSFTVNTYLRTIVKCRNTGLTDTSNTIQVIMAPFYKCYCNPIENITANYILDAIGSFSIVSLSGSDTILNHITGTSVMNDPWAIALTATGSKAGLLGYTNFTDTFPSPTLYLDSSYQFALKAVLPGSYLTSYYPITVYIDYDHSGAFDSSGNELVFNKVASAAMVIPTDTVHIPPTAKKGLTGMRVLTGPYYYSPLAPCGRSGSNFGEIRDYLVNINYAPCKGSIDAGLGVSLPKLPCFGERYLLMDTSHDYKHTGISWSWLTSGDSISWEDMPLTVNRDTLTQIFDTAAWYRLQMVCIATHDTTYSNNIEISPDSPYRCYCYSAAIGGSAHDSSDINSFSFGPYTVNKRGSHLLNVLATEGHERFDDSILDLYADTTYHVTMSPTYRTAFSGNAKVTLFIDYNNNLRYDIPGERLWTAYTSAALWDLTTDIKIPDSAVTDVPTGMRVILNNNVKMTTASDDACDAYPSGETIDFVVRFHHIWTTGVGSISNLEHLVMYPNPTGGKFKISFNSQATIKNLQISVTNMTGQQVFAHSYTNMQGQFNTEIDLSAAARGVYFVTFMADGERMIRKMVLK